MRKIIFTTVTSLFLPFTLQGSEAKEPEKTSIEDSKKCPFTEKQKNEFASDIVKFYFKKNIKDYNRLGDEKTSLGVSALASTMDKSIFNEINLNLDDFIINSMPMYFISGKKCTESMYTGLVPLIKKAMEIVCSCNLVSNIAPKYLDKETYYALIDISGSLFFVNYLHAKGVELLPFYLKTLNSFDDSKDRLAFDRMFKIVASAVNPRFLYLNYYKENL
jgi:hypothetical protein